MKTATDAPTPTFNPTNEEIEFAMSELDTNMYLTMAADDVPTHDIVEWLNESGDTYLEDKAQEFLDEKLDELRHEALDALKEEWERDNLPAEVFVAREREQITQMLADAKEQVASLEARLAALDAPAGRGVTTR